MLDADAQTDVRGGDVDPRMIALLQKLGEKHKIELSVIKTGHAKFSAGGSVSNHFHGRGIDIARVDGEIVRPNSAAARELATEIAGIQGDLRPTEVGTPWAISESGFFTDGAHQDHLHVAFDGEAPADFQAPAAAAPAAPAAAAAAAAPAAPAAPGAPAAAAAAAPPPVPKKGASGQFMAAAAEASAAGKKGGSGVFMTPQAPAGPASAIASPAAVPGVVDAAAAAAPATGSSSLGTAALKVAQTQLGVQEAGTNTGKEVDEYLAAADVGPGNPWCASFVTWALEKAGHKMDGTGWAAVQTWVRNAEQGKNDLKVISAEEARPGDIVTYDWGHDEDFGADGHIGFLASKVEGGKFTALEGNNQDQVMNVPRSVDQANVKFLRIGGDAPAAPAAGVPGAAAATPTPGGAADVAAAAAPAGGGSGAYPGDNASKAAIAKWMGDLAEKRGLPRQLPVMASLVESGVKNLNYGDADSVGFFQMRVGIWNQGAYKGFPEDPELQVKWFLDTAEQVKKQRVAAGKSISDPKQFGEWIADVERPAAQYRGRYQLRLGEANGLLGGAAGAPAAPAAVEQAAAAPAAPAAAADAAASAATGGGGGAGPKALAALKEAQKYTGTKYQWGGSTPQTGFDCSGLVQWAYAKAGIQIPRVTDAQFADSKGTSVERSDLRPGDLVFFGQPGNIYHVGISMGGDKFLHAPKTGDVVKVASLKESYFSSNYAGAKRFDNAAPVAAAPEAAAAAAAAPAIDPKAVAEAQAAVARDAAEVNRSGSGLFMAVKAQEERRHDTVQFMQAVEPKQADGAEPAAAAPAPAAPAAAPAAVEPAAAARRAGRRRARRRRPAGRAARRHLRRLPGRRRVEGRDRQVAREAGRQARPPARAPGHGLARRVRRQEPQLRRRRLRRLLPDARRDLEPGRLQGLPRAPRAAGEVVHRPGARGQEEGDRGRRRRLRQGPVQVGRVDRRHRAPGRAVPRPLPAAAQGGARAHPRLTTNGPAEAGPLAKPEVPASRPRRRRRPAPAASAAAWAPGCCSAARGCCSAAPESCSASRERSSREPSSRWSTEPTRSSCSTRTPSSPASSSSRP